MAAGYVPRAHELATASPSVGGQGQGAADSSWGEAGSLSAESGKMPNFLETARNAPPKRILPGRAGRGGIRLEGRRGGLTC